MELWFREDPRRRRVSRDRVSHLVIGLGGQLLHEATVEEIGYHALLARLPVAAVRTLLSEAGRDAALVQCEQIQFFRATGQMAGVIVEDARFADTPLIEPPAAPLGEPVVALLDGLSLQNHQRLAGRLVIDDPDGYEAEYPANERRHGTAMASLLLYGDLDAGEAPLNRRLHVRPILRPDSRGWTQPRPEVVSEDTLVVDLIHRAVRRLFEGEGDEPASAPQTSVINLSVGIADRPFENALSPLARLLDWLAWKYRVLFIVSAGNHGGDIELAVPRGQAAALTPEDLQREVVRAVAADARHRRLLSPSEAVNAITVGAIHRDASNAQPLPSTYFPFVDLDLPSPFNAQGPGYRRSVKPEAFLPGGRVLLRESLVQGQSARFQLLAQSSRAPGQRVAAPGPLAGDLAYSWHTRGTSNAAALASRSAAQLYDVLDELQDFPGGELIEEVPRSLWLKALLVHGTTWGSEGEILEQVLRNRQNARQLKEYLARLLGYGQADVTRVRECTQRRVTALSGGALQADQAHVHRFPLPPSLSGRRGWRRLTVTLAWLTPIHPANRAWRRAHLWFTPPTTPLQVKRQEAQWQAVQRGTVQHEVLEGRRAAAFVDGDTLEIRVSCRADAGALEDVVPYALATTLEVAEEVGVEIYDEVRVRVHAARVQVVPGA
ncbi:MAG: S8 family peptidase [Deltaproteobacteria bacterium]|nr:S8 family peptidase [Deltaproteobacteria bacterium]